MDETGYMSRALELADRSDGSVAPRPAVGAVIVAADGAIVGEGRTQRSPGPHAEDAALAQAGDRARGATCYVTLEPCVRSSVSQACAERLIEQGVARVVAPLSDPNPAVNGRGFAKLREAGVSVTITDTGRERASEIVAPFARWITTSRPFVTLKLAASLDGKVAAPDGTSRWISGEESRHEVHDLRRRADAIVVGAGTVIADDPELTFRTPGLEGEQPVRVVFDPNGRVPASARMFPGVVVTAPDTEIAAPGADLIRVPRAEGGVDVEAALEALGERGLCHVLLEGGPTLAASFLEHDAVDRFVLYLAPVVIGGDAPGLFGAGVKTLADAYRMEIIDVRRIGPDVRIVAGRR